MSEISELPCEVTSVWSLVSMCISANESCVVRQWDAECRSGWIMVLSPPQRVKTCYMKIMSLLWVMSVSKLCCCWTIKMSPRISHFPPEWGNHATHASTLESSAERREWPSNCVASPPARAAVCARWQLVARETCLRCLVVFVPWHRTFQVRPSWGGVLLSAWERSGRHPATVPHQRGT